MTNVFKNRLQEVIILATIFLTFPSCKKDDRKFGQPQTFYGKEVVVGSGTARSFIKTNESGNPQSIGFTFSALALSNLPMSSVAFLIPVPAENNTMVDHISFDFNAHGHEPSGIYDVPHFDVHFYNISQAEQENISNTSPEMEVLPPATYIPTDYVPIPGGDAKMGKHWTDSTGNEFHGVAFDKTFIYGSYNGQFIFHEAMVALSYLQTKPNATMEIKQQAKVQVGGYYPTKYSISYDEEKQNYTISLDGLQRRISQ
jgi:hypothetical protein